MNGLCLDEDFRDFVLLLWIMKQNKGDGSFKKYWDSIKDPYLILLEEKFPELFQESSNFVKKTKTRIKVVKPKKEKEKPKTVKRSDKERRAVKV